MNDDEWLKTDGYKEIILITINWLETTKQFTYQINTDDYFTAHLI